MTWAVELRIHSVSGCPETDPIVAVEVSCPDDENCHWTTAPVPAIIGTAYIGAWTTIIVENGDELEFKLVEKAPLVKCLKSGPMTATASLNLLDLANETAEAGGSGAAEGTWSEVKIAMDAGEHSKKIAHAMDETLAKAAKAAERMANVGHKKDGESEKKEERENDKNGAVDDETGAGSSLEDQTIELRTVKPAFSRSSTLAGLFSLGSVELRASVRVTPVENWRQEPGSFEQQGGALEQTATPIPRSLHSYAHGGFMGLACSVLGDPEWSAILKEESPADWKALQMQRTKIKVLGQGEQPHAVQTSYMPVLENSPVMCAYGMVRGGSTVQITKEMLEQEQAVAAAATPAADAALRLTPLKPVASLNAPGVQEMSTEVSAPIILESSVQESKKSSGARLRYEQSLTIPNIYGYRPLGMEWDIWVSPKRPESLLDATINHGTSTALVTQAILTTVPGLKCAAQRSGAKQIINYGMSPAEWLTQLGHAVNRGVSGDKNTPLPLAAPEEIRWRMHVSVDKITGLDSERWSSVVVYGDIDSDDVVLPDKHTAAGNVNSDGTATWSNTESSGAAADAGAADENKEEKEKAKSDAEGGSMSFWPLPEVLEYDDLLLTFKGRVAGAVVMRQRGLGLARVRLMDIVAQHPQILKGEEVEIEMDVGPWEKHPRRVNVEREIDEDETIDQESGVLSDEDEDLKSMCSDAVTTTTTTENDGIGDVEMGTLSSGDEIASASPKPAKKKRKKKAPAVPSRVTLRLRLEPVGVISAMESLGVPRAAAQTAVAMLSKPGGLYLDVKSAYSTAYDMQVFVSTLMGIGVYTKAVCSFKPEQLRVGAIADVVHFFHGLSGVENACDSGQVPRGRFVLFNGASFLADLRPTEYESMSASAVEKVLGTATSWPIDELALRKYAFLCDQYELVGGFYIQEPDAAPCGIDALCALVAQYPSLFPLGFAYGHLSGRAVGFFDSRGRGFATQQIVEEFAARKDLSGKAIKRIKAGEHRTASLTEQIVIAGRLLHGEDMISIKEQKALCTLLAEMQPDAAVVELVNKVGGVGKMVSRYHQHYELTTPLTLLEAGMNLNYTKSLLRVLRNRGVLAALTKVEKCEFASFLVGPSLRGYGMTYLMQASGIRRGLHKHAKEGLLCLLESCTARECRAVLVILGGREAAASLLRGWFRWSWHYNRRLKEIEAVHAKDPEALAYLQADLKYAALPEHLSPKTFDADESGPVDLVAACHTRDKTKLESSWRYLRKSACCGFTCVYTCLLDIITLGTFVPFCVCPRFFGSTLKGKCGIGAVCAIILGFVIAIALILLLLLVWVPNKRRRDLLRDAEAAGIIVDENTTKEDIFEKLGKEDPLLLL